MALEAAGNSNAAFDSKQFTRNERAARTLRVFSSHRQAITRNIPDVDCDAIGIEVSFHVHDVGKSDDYEGRDILVVVMDRKDRFQMVLEKEDNAQQGELWIWRRERQTYSLHQR